MDERAPSSVPRMVLGRTLICGLVSLIHFVPLFFAWWALVSLYGEQVANDSPLGVHLLAFLLGALTYLGPVLALLLLFRGRPSDARRRIVRWAFRAYLMVCAGTLAAWGWVWGYSQ